MRTIFFILVFSILSLAGKNDSLTGFWGINWGASKAEVRKAMTDKGATEQDFGGGPLYLGFNEVTFAGETPFIIGFIFSDRGFCKVGMSIKENIEANVLDKYDALKDLYVKKYGEPSRSWRTFKDPYEDGDGYETQALKTGKGFVGCYWAYPNGVDSNTVYISVDNELDILIQYENGKLMKSVTKEIEKKKLGDL